MGQVKGQLSQCHENQNIENKAVVCCFAITNNGVDILHELDQ